MKKKLITYLLCAALVVSCIFSVNADEITDMQAEAEYNQQRLNDLNSSIDSLEEQKTELLGEISKTDEQLVLTLATISTLNSQIALKSQQLSETTKSLQVAEEEEATEYEAMKKRIQYIYEAGENTGWAAMLLNDTDISDLLNRAEYTQQIYEYDRQCLEQYNETVKRVRSLKEQYEQEKLTLEYMVKNEEDEQAYLEEQLTSLRAESDNFDEQLSNAVDLAAQYVDLINEQNYIIQELLEEQERQRAAAEAAAAAAEAAAAEAAAAEQAAAEAAAEEARRAAEEAQRAAEEAEDEAARQAAEEAQRAAEEAQRAAEEAARQAAEEAQRAAEEAEQGGGDDYGDGGYDDGGYDDGGADTPYYAETGNAIVDRAMAWVGRAQYVFGACSPGAFDCSGFVSYCVTGSYSRVGTASSFYSMGSVSDPMPGDICALPGHVGIYIGDGMMAHAADPSLGVLVSPVMDGMIFVRY